MAPSGSEAPRGITRWLIVVAADERDLYEHLREIFEGDRLVEVVLDCRQDPERTPAWLRERLRSHGAVVIPRPA
jgi:hypothetical protein